MDGSRRSSKSPQAIVGTAGWSVPRDAAPAFADTGSHLERYASRLPGVEINSSFYRPHRVSTYAKWAAAVPAGFLFSVKIPKSITHERGLVDVEAPLEAFLAEVGGLREHLGPLLVQLPPSRVFDAAVMSHFLVTLRARHAGSVAIEPRHPSWFTGEAHALLVEHGVSGVAADPARVPAAAIPWGDTRLVYYRLHGSPVIYRSSYDDGYLDRLTAHLLDWRARGATAWCIFDNTANGAAAANALAVDALYSRGIAGSAGVHITNT